MNVTLPEDMVQPVYGTPMPVPDAVQTLYVPMTDVLDSENEHGRDARPICLVVFLYWAVSYRERSYRSHPAETHSAKHSEPSTALRLSPHRQRDPSPRPIAMR